MKEIFVARDKAAEASFAEHFFNEEMSERVTLKVNTFSRKELTHDWGVHGMAVCVVVRGWFFSFAFFSKSSNTLFAYGRSFF